jgi:hypothetical protein
MPIKQIIKPNFSPLTALAIIKNSEVYEFIIPFKASFFSCTSLISIDPFPVPEAPSLQTLVKTPTKLNNSPNIWASLLSIMFPSTHKRRVGDPRWG